MDIDLYQLPVPDWNLTCPTCGYLLNGLPAHRCPECGTSFDVPELIRSWVTLRNPRFSGHELPFPDFGLACAQCGFALAGAEQPACPECHQPFDPPSIRPTGEWFLATARQCLGIPIHIVMMMLDEAGVPYVVQERHSAFVNRPVEVFVASEFYFDFLQLIHARTLENEGPDDDRLMRNWQCPSCGEENPGHFEVCWNCSHQRD